MPLITKQILNSFSQTPAPFQIFPFKTVGKDEYYLQVQPGTINNILPNNIISTNTLASFPYSANKINYIILECKTNGKYINSALIKVGSSVPKIQDPVAWGLPSTIEVLIGGVYNTIAYQVVNSNISLGVRVAYVLNSKDNTSLPFVPYYIWA